MATYNLGRILPIFRGEYQVGTTYNKLDIVHVEGYGSYVAKQTVSSVQPQTHPEIWELVSKDGTASGFSGDYNDLINKPVIPTKTSQLRNDSYYITTTSLRDYATEEWVEEQGYLTEHQDISGKADKSELPTKISDLENDSDFLLPQDLNGYATETWVESKGYLTEHQDISNYATKNWVENKNYLTEHQSLAGYATETWVESKNYLTEHQDISGKADKSEIPTKTSQLTNDSGYLTEHQDISGKADKSEIPTKTSQLTNDSNYTTKSYVDGLVGNINNILETI